MALLSLSDKTALKAYLSDFYSVGQLGVIYATYTDGGIIPGMSERDKAMRVDAIGEILGKNVSLPVTVQTKKRK